MSRIEEYDPALNSVITLNTDAALTAARAADQAVTDGTVLGPLHGVPFGLKDIIDAAHLPTTAHSRIYVNNTPIEDAAVTEYLKQSGAILLAKLATHEFAFGGPSFDLPWPPARNPWDTRMFTGGSSSGSGAAVAAGLIPLALGTDPGRIGKKSRLSVRHSWHESHLWPSQSTRGYSAGIFFRSRRPDDSHRGR
ncbi:MAG: hypothetical protein CM1200mP41_30620 [Gammaproteobacteria bacterium]|nr:MAG: hypothetical protein CM1200mP41_30620 [Gammaproteobacteria bacterium]